MPAGLPKSNKIMATEGLPNSSRRSTIGLDVDHELPRFGLEQPPKLLGSRMNEFVADNNSFAFILAQFFQLLSFKGLVSFFALIGLGGIGKGLRTGRENELAPEETQVEGNVSSKDALMKNTFNRTDNYELIQNPAPLYPLVELRTKPLKLGGASHGRKGAIGRGGVLDSKEKSFPLFPGITSVAKWPLVLFISSVVCASLQLIKDYLPWFKNNGQMSVSLEGIADLVPADGSLIGGFKAECDELNGTRESDLSRETPVDKVFAASAGGFLLNSNTYRVTRIGVNPKLSCFEHVVSSIAQNLTGYYSRASKNKKFAILGICMFYGAPLVSAILTVEQGLRVASGVSASGTAVVIVGLRTLEETLSTAGIIMYVAWVVCLSTYLWLNFQLVSSNPSHWRKLYLFCVIFSAIHFSVALTQNSDTIVDGFTIYGPIILTVNVYLMSLLFAGRDAPKIIGIDTSTVIGAALGSPV